MKKAHLMVMMEQIQEQNIRLKNQIIAAHKKLKSFQNAMVEQLTKIGKVKPHYETPEECLQAYSNEFHQKVEEHLAKTQEIDRLNTNLIRFKRQIDSLTAVIAQKQKIITQLTINLKQAQRERLQFEKNLKNQISILAIKQKEAREVYQEMTRTAQLKQMERQQQQRTAIAAAVSSAKHQMIEYKGKLEAQFIHEAQKLRAQIKNRDESIKRLSQSFSKLGNQNTIGPGQVTQLEGVLVKIFQFKDLTAQIASLREQSSEFKRKYQDTMNKKQSYEIRLSELKTEICNHESKYKRKEIELKEMAQTLAKVRQELGKQKSSNENLQKYYQQKWVEQFDRVKRNLQKMYADRVKEHERQLQAKKVQISRRIQSYIFVHSEDEKFIKQLKGIIVEKQHDKAILTKTIKDLHSHIEQLTLTLSQTNHMIVQSEQAYAVQLKEKMARHEQKIQQLKGQIQLVTLEYEKAKIVVLDVQKQCNRKFQQKRQELYQKYQQEMLEVVKVKQQEIRLIEQNNGKKEDQWLEKQKIIRREHDQTLFDIQRNHQKAIAQKEEEIELHKKTMKSIALETQKKQKLLNKEISDLKQELQQKFKFLQLELESRRSSLKFQQDRSQKDKKIKQQLRQLVDLKLNENKQLLKDKSNLMDQIEAQKSQIHHLNSQLQIHRFTKNDWQRRTQELKDQFTAGLAQIQRIYAQQEEIFKSKIWELQNIILTRPMRAKDQIKIKHLSEKQRQLQSMVELKQAENGVLKQIKQYYEQKTQLKKLQSDQLINIVEHRKNPSVLIVTRRHRMKRASNYQLPANNQLGEPDQAREDVQRMKHYIASKVRQGQKTARQGKEFHSSRIKTLYNPHRSVDK